METNSFGQRKYGEYIRDFTSLGNPFLLLSFAYISSIALGMPLEHFGLLLLAFGINEGLCSGIKFWWHKPRPDQQHYKNDFEKIDAGSFPSIHSSRLSLLGGALAYIAWQQELLALGIMWLSWVALVGYSRIFLKRHFLTDVAAGYFLGFFQAFLFCFLLNY